MEVRKRLAERLQRGTIDMFLSWESDSQEVGGSLNTALAKQYYEPILALEKDLGIEDHGDIIPSILRMPDVISSRKGDIVNEDNWPAVSAAIDAALDAIDRYRSDEGRSLYADVTGRVSNIRAL